MTDRKAHDTPISATVQIDEANGARKATGTTTSTSAGKLVDSGAGFVAAGVAAGDEVHNTTDDTYGFVTAVDSATQLSMSADVFPTTKAYTIQGTQTANITNSNMGSTDAVNLNPVSNPVLPGANTYEKFQRFHVTNMGGSSSIQDLRVWRSGALGGAATHVTNARTAAYARKPYTAPTAAGSSLATQAMPTSDPGGANLGIGGSTAGSITVAGDAAYSDFVVHQIQTNVADVAGSTSTLYAQYDEIA